MPNPQDENRVSDSARSASVTDLNVFKAQRGDVSVSTPYFSFAIGAGMFLLLAIVFFFMLARR